MTPVKQQISFIPFSIEHTSIALTSDGVFKIGEIKRSVSVCNRECKPPLSPKFETKVIRDSLISAKNYPISKVTT